MSKDWHNESSEEFAGVFSEERQVHHLQAIFENIGIKYDGAPDAPTRFVDFVVPADVIAVTQEPRE
jgi:hypothetical protein